MELAVIDAVRTQVVDDLVVCNRRDEMPVVFCRTLSFVDGKNLGWRLNERLGIDDNFNDTYASVHHVMRTDFDKLVAIEAEQDASLDFVGSHLDISIIQDAHAGARREHRDEIQHGNEIFSMATCFIK